ncbi:MAG TPA: type I methionyl aminopeptidase [Phototrophicaceae bacterium]|jgi:methionyl aminopeptidase|nr:type I methionyl aminopeptidase [Phototrophicaceae bacterium]
MPSNQSAVNSRQLKIHIKTPEEVAIMREAGRIVARTHQAMKEALRPGVTTAQLDKIAEMVIRDHGAVPVFLQHTKPNSPPFPASITASVNYEVVHGIPSQRELNEGDIVSLDTGVKYKGFVGDSAWSYVVGEPSPMVKRLLEVGEQSLYAGIRTSVLPNDIREVALAIQKYIVAHGYDMVREYTGHGVGREMWEDPQVPNWWSNNKKDRRQMDNPKLVPGMTYAIEPMVVAGRAETKELSDKWTVVTKDKSLAVHFEHTIAITDGEPLILTQL